MRDMAYSIDPSVALNSAASQDLEARRRATESLSSTETAEERRSRLREACEGFESIFIQKMWEQMRASLPKDGLMHSKEEDFWQAMYDQELGKHMASAGGIGLTDMMMEQLDRRDGDISNATRQSTMRHPALDIAPAPLFIRPAQDKIQMPGQDGQVPGNPAQTGIYDGEAAQPKGDVYPDVIEPAATIFTTNIPDEQPTDPSVVSQTLDDLAALAVSQQQAALRNVPHAAAGPGISTAATQNVHLEFQRMTGQAPPRPGTLTPAPYSGKAEVVPGADEAVAAALEPPAPQVTRITYQTNLPPTQRQASPVQNPAMYQPKDQAEPVATTAQAVPAQEAQIAQTPQTPPPASAIPTVRSEPSAPIQQADILAGIGPRYMPSRVLNQLYDQFPSEQVLMAEAASTVPAQAGGPVYRGPERPHGAVALGNPEPPKGSLLAPVQGEVSSSFGWRLDPFTGQRAWHTGVDIAAAPGEGVQAAMDGVVSFAGLHPELGNLIIVEHADGLRTFYGHNQNLNVRPGDEVSAGTIIANVGSSGRASGAHIHFEVRRGDLALNPEPLISHGNARLTAAR